MTPIEALRARIAQLAGSMSALTAAAEAAKRDLTPDEHKQFDEADTQLRAAEQEVATLERMEEVKAKLALPAPRRVQPEDGASVTAAPVPGSTSISGGTLRAHTFANHGFAKGAGEFLVSVHNAAYGKTDPRLMVNSVSTFGGEQVGADGGFLVPPDFAQGILNAVQSHTSFLGALNPVQTSSNMLVVNTDQDAPWDDDAGITVDENVDGDAITPSKEAFAPVNVVLYSAKALVHVSEEQLEDVPFLTSSVMTKMADKIQNKLESWMMNGSGDGKPLGILQGPGLVTVAKESTQTRANTPLQAENVAKMFAGLLPGGTSRAFWIMNPTVLPYLWTLALSGYPLYIPDFSKAPGGMLLGRPIYLSERCALAGSAGDVVCQDPVGYVYATKAGGIKTATTIGFAFDQALQSFRASVRVGGSPVLKAKIARAASASSYAGHSIVLAAS